jgi:hypothetical protein
VISVAVTGGGGGNGHCQSIPTVIQSNILFRTDNTLVKCNDSKNCEGFECVRFDPNPDLHFELCTNTVGCGRHRISMQKFRLKWEF